MTSEATIEPLVEHCLMVPSDTPCSEVGAHIFNRGNRHTLLVRADDGELGVVSREHFLHSMAGAYGYGRQLLARQGIGELTHWGMPAVTPDTPVATAAALMMGSEAPEGFRDLPVVGADGDALGIIRPVRLMRALADDAARRAETDGLTGLATRARVIAGLEDAIAGLDDGDARVIVAFLDLDRLKHVNDSLGHGAGDALLRSASRRLLAVAGGADVVGRLGGDEFVVVARMRLPAAITAEDAALAYGERLRAALAQHDPDLPDSAQARASVGVAVESSPGADAEALLRLADTAMYSAKLGGGDRVQYGRRSAQGVDAILTDALHLMFQPIIDTATGMPTAVEALLRAHTAADDSNFPADIKLRAVRQGATLELDRWVLSRACRSLRRWQADGLEAARRLRMHVNLSPETLVAPGLADELLTTIAEAGVAPDRIVLELSELSRVGDINAASLELAALDAAGVSLALDDVGVSLDTLRLLQQQLPLSLIKVDRTVVAGAGRGNAVDAEVLSVIARIAAQLKVEIIAEGVETMAESEAVARAGIRHEQGFLRFRPMSEPLLRARLASAAALAMRR
ncbi:EAL domain-containing protein [Demequina capsici]|uniref:EAL domain-containing protein n=1 Tax=Demequina capsici TaxID=3075620 RepID=A0AA96JDI8_9MICO|nr:EAL domain-containing protein [Demequina sp. PMTSA13]WNM28126.1 EAL domain-containing protein [Demequina sp. PMTSA13]